MLSFIFMSLVWSYAFVQGEDSDSYIEPPRFSPIVKPQVLPDPFVLEFEDIEKTMRSSSALFMSMAANREVLQYNRNQLAEQQRNANSSIHSLATAMSGLSQLRAGLDAAFTASAYAGVMPTYTDLALKGAVEAQLQLLGGQLSAQAVAASTADKGYAAGGNLSATVTQLDDAGLQLIYGASQMFHGYWLIDRQIALLEEELSLLQLQLKVVVLLEELGRTPGQNIQSINEGISAMENGLFRLRLEQSTLQEELNLLLGRPAGSILILQPIPAPDINMLSNTDFEAARQATYRSSYLLRGKRFIQGGLQENYDDVVRNFGELGDRAWRAEQQLEGAKLETKLAEEQFHLRFSKLVAKLEHDLAAYNLELAKLQSSSQNLERAVLRHELGYLSDNDLLREHRDFNKQQAAVRQAEDDLALGWQKWLLVQKGMDIGSGE